MDLWRHSGIALVLMWQGLVFVEGEGGKNAAGSCGLARLRFRETVQWTCNVYVCMCAGMAATT